MKDDDKGPAGVPFYAAPQSQMRDRTEGMVREAGRKTEHVFEGLPVFFNPTAPPSLLIVCGPDDDPDKLELHGREDAYRANMGDDRMREAARRLVRMIRAGLRMRKGQRAARLN